MSEIGIPFVFVNTERHGQLPLPRSSYLPARAPLRRMTRSFSKFRGLPAELRVRIMKFHIEETLDRRKRWLDTKGKPLVVQLRPGVLHVQLQDKKPPSLAPSACVNHEWRAEVEKQLFKSLRLEVVPDSGPSEYYHLDKFSTYVTGARRRCVKMVQLDVLRKYSFWQPGGPQAVPSYLTGGSFECVLRLLRTLATWAPKEVADGLPAVTLNVTLQDFSLHCFQKEIRKMADIETVGALHIKMDPRDSDFSKLPLALPCLFRKLPSLRSVRLSLSPWCFSREDDRDYKIQEFMREIRTATPQLTKLEFSQPFVSAPQTMELLARVPIVTIRETSYRLKEMRLTSSIDLSVFFENFYNRSEDGALVSRPLWQHLEKLWLKGPIVTRGDRERSSVMDAFLRATGRAIKHMPKLKAAIIWTKDSTLARAFNMTFAFWHLEYSQTKKPVLEVSAHTPSVPAVRIWKEAVLYTKRMDLYVEFRPTPSVDANGAVVSHDWQVWRD